MRTFLCSVAREKKYPQVGFILVWNGEMELETEAVDGRLL